MSQNTIRLLKTKEVSEILGVSIKTIGIWREESENPIPFFRKNRSIRYDLPEVMRWYKDKGDNS